MDREGSVIGMRIGLICVRIML